ncbi:MAG: hypothetical protein B6I20_05570 [Bacteroidetes bacterium 4572_117]|nr:MAG: hypothetical protein B6I20_05570 [Bacteroidetes bacterium 4572_117]
MKITKAQIEAWKKKHGDVFMFTNEDDAVCYLKLADRKTLAYAQAAAGNDPIKFNEIILEDCWLGGDERFKTDDAWFLGVSAKLDELIKVSTGKLEKL